MHYQHRFHAGNFADVFKHVLLCGLVQALCRKDKPWLYLETHAGTSAYDLADAGATRTGEWRDGIARLWDHKSHKSAVPPMLDAYLRIVRAENPSGTLGRYPGSPAFVQALAREQDRLVLCEKVPEIQAQLREEMRGDARVAVHQRDGYEGHALLPPAEKRGLILVDPPFERGDEFDAVAELLGRAVGRFAQGCFAAWYPLKNRHVAERWLRRIARETQRPTINATLDTGAPSEGQMHACGLLIINPPFGFAQEAEAALAKLKAILAQGPRPRYAVEVLVPETAA